MKLKKIITATMLVGVLAACNKLQLTRLTTPSSEKIARYGEEIKKISQKSFESYTAFAKKFSYLMLRVNNSTDEKSMAVSIPDAYISLAIMAAISTDTARNDILSYLELNNMEQLKTATSEIVGCLGTLTEGRDGNISGGYNLNSLWFNPEKVDILPKDNNLYKDLEDIFDASLFNEGLTSERAKQYIKENGLKDLPIPDIKLNEEPAALSAMSVFYCIDRYDHFKKNYLYNQFTSGTHLMDYYINNVLTKQNYIENTGEGFVFEGEGFHGTNYYLDNLTAQFFLPDERNAMPSTILEDAINENYELKSGIGYYEVGEEFETNAFEVTLKAPYFSIDTDCRLEDEVLRGILPEITKGGAGERIAKAKAPGAGLYLNSIKQFSTMKFDYEGFYSCSATIAEVEATAPLPPTLETYDITLDHPYAFKIQKYVRFTGEGFNGDYLPLVIGEVVDPNYK